MIELVDRITRDQVAEPAQDFLTLTHAERQRTRQRVVLGSRRDAGIFLPRQTPLRDGDQLRSRNGLHVEIRAASETLSNARADDSLQLARACYHLGNRHVALEIGDGWVRYTPDHVLDEMVQKLGLEVAAIDCSFEPERGAYHGDGGHHHHHSHEGE